MSGAKPFPRVKIALIAAFCLVVAAVVMFSVLFRGGQPGDEVSAAPPVPAVSRPPDSTPAGSPETPQSDVSGALEQAVAEAVRDAEAKTATNVGLLPMSDEQKRRMERMMAIQIGFWEQEDRVMASVPKYRDVKDQYRKKAEALLAGVDAADPKAVQALSDAELAVFWEKGGLVNPESYEHAYLARAVLEIACERSPEDFQLLSSLKEAICATTPEHLSDFTPIPENIDELWAVVQRQKELFDKGKVPPSIDALGALDDWICLGTLHKKLDHAAVGPVCQWLIDNADAGGWRKLNKRFAVGLDDSRSVLLCREPNLYVYPIGRNLEDDCITKAANTRRIPSFKGSPKFQSGALRVWEPWPGRDAN